MTGSGRGEKLGKQPPVTLCILTRSETETLSVGARLSALLCGGSVVLLNGDLGAGKTRFAKGVARGLGVRQEITSPTYNLVLEYPLDVDGACQDEELRHAHGTSGACPGQGPEAAPSAAGVCPDEAPVLGTTEGQSAARPRHSRGPGTVGQQPPRELRHSSGSAATVAQPPRMLRHFDLYRLESAEQLDDLDYFGLIEQEDAVSLVEWGGKFAEALPLDYLLIDIGHDGADPEKRILRFSAEGPRSEETLARFVASEEAGQYD